MRMNMVGEGCSMKVFGESRTQNDRQLQEKMARLRKRDLKKDNLCQPWRKIKLVNRRKWIFIG